MNDVGNPGLAFMQAFWGGDLVACDALLTPDATWHFQLGMTQAQDARGRIWPAREAMHSIVADLFGKFDDSGFSVKTTSVIANATSVAIEYEASGRTSAGDAYQNYYVTVLATENGRVSAVRPYNDTLHMYKLLA